MAIITSPFIAGHVETYGACVTLKIFSPICMLSAFRRQRCGLLDRGQRIAIVITMAGAAAELAVCHRGFALARAGTATL
ncbi:hypothetical protein WJ85_17340 [Burkholderia ubonensis]|nr:hypothetical protein WJ85_17340 [Burkholderia ubonensis]